LSLSLLISSFPHFIFFWCFPSLPSNQRKKLRKRDLCFNFFFGLMTHEKVLRDKSGSYVHFFYMFINVCYELMIGWNYGSGNDRNGEKMAPCFPRGHFARWCLLHGLSKRPWLTRPKDTFCRYNMLPSQDAERFVFFIPPPFFLFCDRIC
jgi:hypothetical protein